MRGTLESSGGSAKEDRAGANEETGKGEVLISYFQCVQKEVAEAQRS